MKAIWGPERLPASGRPDPRGPSGSERPISGSRVPVCRACGPGSRHVDAPRRRAANPARWRVDAAALPLLTHAMPITEPRACRSPQSECAIPATPEPPDGLGRPVVDQKVRVAVGVDVVQSNSVRVRRVVDAEPRVVPVFDSPTGDPEEQLTWSVSWFAAARSPTRPRRGPRWPGVPDSRRRHPTTSHRSGRPPRRSARE